VLKKPTLHKRQIPLVILLALVLGVWIYTLVDSYQMRQDLAKASVDDVANVVSGFSSEPGVETITRVAANREFVLFGTSRGTVTVFFKEPAADGGSEYSGMVIGFEERDDEWVMTESRGFERDEVDRAQSAFGD